MFHLYVNGNEVHDEGEHDAQGRVTRMGGGRLDFATKEEAERAADAAYTADLERFKASRLGRFPGLAPKRDRYVVAEEPPTSD